MNHHEAEQIAAALVNISKESDPIVWANMHEQIAGIYDDVGASNPDYYLPKIVFHYQKALEIDPEDGETHYNMAAVLDQDGQLEKAIEHYQISVSFGIVQAENTLRNARARWDAMAIENEKKNTAKTD